MDGGWLPQPHREPDQFGYGEDLALVEAVAGVRRLRTWAALEARRLAREPQSQATDDDTPWRHYTTVLIGRFADVYERFFDGPLYTSPPEGGEPYGSGIDYLRACLLALGIDEMTPDAMVQAIHRWRGDRR